MKNSASTKAIRTTIIATQYTCTAEALKATRNGFDRRLSAPFRNEVSSKVAPPAGVPFSSCVCSTGTAASTTWPRWAAFEKSIGCAGTWLSATPWGTPFATSC